MKQLLSIAIALSLIAAPLAAEAHSGRTNKYGCHNDNVNGGYHCHNGGSSSGGSQSSSGSSAVAAPVAVEHHFYNVFADDLLMTVVDGYDTAVSYASALDHGIVQDANSYEIVWDNIYSQVFQYGKYVSDFGSRKGATDWAKGHEYSYVLDVKTEQILWHNYPYVVYQGETYLDWFRQKSDAINYAKQWANSKVVDGLTYQAVWNK